MRRLKTYQLFESVDSEEVLSTIRDMLLELDFLDIESDCHNIGGDAEFIVINLQKCLFNNNTHQSLFTYDDVRHVIDSIVEYLSDNGYKLYPYANVSDDNSIYSTTQINKNDDDSIILRTFMHIYFKKK